jgi:hemolysin activation/secretion protein
MPLPWRHYIELSSTYARVRPSFFGSLITQDGQSIVADLRYAIPVGGGNRTAEFFSTLDFKESNNNLQFGGSTVSAAKVDTFQFETGFTMARTDNHGTTVFGATLNLSPGDINSRNTAHQFQPDTDPAHYHVGRYGAVPTYETAIVNLQRIQKLGRGWDIWSRFTGQLTTTNLVSNEQLTIGGANTVRGFQENIFTGDQGYVLNTDLESPTLDRKLSYRKNSPKSTALQLRAVAFYDLGEVFNKHPFPSDPVLHPLASAGFGLRATISNNLSANFDYGWQITRLPTPTDYHTRGHIKLVLAF